MATSIKPLFNRKILNAALKRMALAQIPDLGHKRQVLAKWRQMIAADTLKGVGEVSLHGVFLHDLFADALGYAQISDAPDEWNLAQEQKTAFDATTPDAALGFFTSAAADTRAVIELKAANANLDAKQHRTHDKRSAVEQAFGYVPKSGKTCTWVIVSNYVEVRLYHKNSMAEYESFSIAELDGEAEFLRFYALLARDRLLARTGLSPVEALYQQSEEEEQRISKRFYAEYTATRTRLFEHLKTLNPDVDELLLLEKTQKLLDRFIFVCFCEDTGMLPARIFRKVVAHAQESFSMAEHKVWQELKGLFRAIDQGAASRNIHGFNGELFKPDPALDALRIGDEAFLELAAITDYDFDSDLNVNILGHIFEQSITDLEELRAGIRGEPLDRKKGKRKKEGVFYTPEYITRYIVEQAVGGWLNDRKQELGAEALPDLTPEDYASIKQAKSGYKGNARVEQHRRFWDAYKERLMAITVLDPACGSGAFLNQAFDFLYREGQQVNKALADLSKGQTTVFDLNRHILSTNLYGVDLNRESVEITKLSLWLKTANKQSQLTALDDNIRCGNSLIDNPLVAGDKAFDWARQFPAIMQRGGFDVVIGNPPYVPTELMSNTEKEFYRTQFRCLERKYDTSIIFVLKGMSLINLSGYLSYISSLTWQTGENFTKFRKEIFESYGLLQIINLPFDVFENAYVDTGIYLFQKSNIDNCYRIYQYPKRTQLSSLSDIQFEVISRGKIEAPDYKIILTKRIEPLIEKLKTDDFELLGNITESTQGLAGNKYEVLEYEGPEIYPYLVKGQVYRYTFILESIKYTDMSGYSTLVKYYSKNKRILVRRIINRQNRLMATYCEQDLVVRKDLNPFIINDEHYDILYILALLNSKFFSYLYLNQSSIATKDDFRQTTLGELRKLRIYKASKEQQHPFIKEANTLLDLNQQLHAAVQKFLRFLEASYQPNKLSTKLRAFYALEFGDFVKELKKQKVKLTKQAEFELLDLFEDQRTAALALRARIDRTDREIDRMVYELYGLTQEEIELVEGR